jgi:hypothetical protein
VGFVGGNAVDGWSAGRGCQWNDSTVIQERREEEEMVDERGGNL